MELEECRAISNVEEYVTVYEAFCGIGGFSLGFKRAGFEIVGGCEIDPYARAVYTKNFGIEPDGDIRTIQSVQADIICGGFPCQDISIANPNRKGLDGERSGLWFELSRIIKNSSPRWVVLENVSALLGLGMGDVLRSLSEIGYDAEWDCLPASAFGATHRRDRIFIIAYPSSKGLSRHQSRQCEQEIDDFKRLTFSGYDYFYGSKYPHIPENLRVDDGVPNRLDRTRCLGNAIVPQISYFIAKRIKQLNELP